MGTNGRKGQGNSVLQAGSRKLTLAVALAFTAAAGPAMAGAGVKVFSDDKGDSISLFGIIDAGVLTQNNSTNANGTRGGGITQEAANGLRQSVWGIKGGSGDLGIGGNSTAFFNLESHFDTTTGLLHGTGDVADQATPLFRRQANVGLTGDWGTLILGRQYGPALLADLNTEPRYFKEQFSNLYAWAYGQLNTTGAAGAGTNRNSNNDVGIFFENAVQYRNTWGPVTLGVLYSFGGTNNGFSYNSVKALGLEYKGPVIVSGSYEDMKDATTGKTDIRHTSLGAAYPWNDFTFKTLWMQAVNNDANSGNEIANVNSFGVGSDWRWNSRNTATLAFYYNHDKDHSGDSTRNIVLSDDFAMNSWVTAYFQYAYVNAGSSATLLTSIVAAGIPQRDAKTSLLNIGLNFSF